MERAQIHIMSKHRITLIRHARTKGNSEKRYIGCRSDDPVSDEGIAQLESIDQSRLPEPDRLFCGPMKRCKTTAAYLFPDREAEIAPEMIEMDFGLYEGMNDEDLKDDPYYSRWIESGGTLPFPEGEDMAGFVTRSMTAFRMILDRLSDNESAVIVCHGGNIMSIVSALTNRDYFDFDVDNVSGYSLDIEYDGETIDVLSYERFSTWTDT